MPLSCLLAAIFVAEEESGQAVKGRMVPVKVFPYMSQQSWTLKQPVSTLETFLWP